jgi:hypothetical protein
MGQLNWILKELREQTLPSALVPSRYDIAHPVPIIIVLTALRFRHIGEEEALSPSPITSADATMENTQ